MSTEQKPREIKIVVTQQGRFIQPFIPLNFTDDGEYFFIEKPYYDSLQSQLATLEKENQRLRETLERDKPGAGWMQITETHFEDLLNQLKRYAAALELCKKQRDDYHSISLLFNDQEKLDRQRAKREQEINDVLSGPGQ